MDYMRDMKDNEFELAIVDPPYGIGEDGKGTLRHRSHLNVYTHFNKKEWDVKKPTSDYFGKLFQVSKNQLIFGANYFVENLFSSMGWIFWNKLMGGDFSDGELIFTSYQRALKIVTMRPERNCATNPISAEKWKRIHPCQKPVKLYEWLLQNYAKPGDRILDTHGGSMSLVIACINMGHSITCFEKDKDYYDTAVARIEEHKKQQRLFI